MNLLKKKKNLGGSTFGLMEDRTSSIHNVRTAKCKGQPLKGSSHAQALFAHP